MATQWLTVATIVGDAGDAVQKLFQTWREGPNPPEPATVDQFCDNLRRHGFELPILYYCEWLDRWLMGDEVPGPGTIIGKRYEATCLSLAETKAWVNRIRDQFDEQRWLKARLSEAVVWDEALKRRLVVAIIRQVLESSTLDEEIQAALNKVPSWLRNEAKSLASIHSHVISGYAAPVKPTSSSCDKAVGHTLPPR